jgi:collagen type I/II/III/V/XI/XXIV/XXVII alpha
MGMTLKATLTASYSTAVTLTGAIYADPVTVTGTVRVSGSDASVYAPSAWTIANSGSIENVDTSSPGVGISLAAGGAVNNAAGGYIFGTFGIDATGGATTVTNAGTITGGSDAVALPAGFADRLVADPGAVFSGRVGGGNAIGGGIASTLELASGASSGTLLNLGSQFVDFAQTTVDAGASWVLLGQNTNVAGATLTDSGTLVIGYGLTNGGSVAGVVVAAPDATITNLAGGVMNGGSLVDIYSGPASTGISITNAGVLMTSGGTHAVTGLHDGGYVDNQAGGTITSYGGPGVYIKGAVGTVVNAGSIAAAKAAVYIYHTAGTLLNSGNITGGAIGAAVAFSGGGYVSNAGTGVISSAEHSAIYMTGGASRVLNAGTIGAPGSAGAGIIFASGGVATNLAGGTISAADGAGVYGKYAAASLVNAGSVAGGSGAPGVALDAGGYVENAATGVITSPQHTAVYITGGPGTVVNSGNIENPGSGIAGVALLDGGAVHNNAGGTIASALHAGVSIAGAGTVVNAGSIGGSGTAVVLAAGFANRVQVLPGAVFGGIVNGGNAVGAGVASTLELAAGSGSLYGVGSSFIDFASIVLQTRAAWDIHGSTAGLAGGEVITGFTSGDTIDLVGVTETIDNFATGTLTLSGSATLELDLPGAFTTPRFSATPSGDGTAITVACFAEGTLVLTDAGEVAVENLRPGMRVVSLTHHGLLPVAWVGQRRMRAADVVRVAAGAFGMNVPHRDLFLSPDHAVYIDDKLIPVRELMNGVSIVAERREEVCFFHVELASHGVLVAEGLAAESYLDTGNREGFEGKARALPWTRQRPRAFGNPFISLS